jgi:hypothetical protein
MAEKRREARNEDVIMVGYRAIELMLRWIVFFCESETERGDISRATQGDQNREGRLKDWIASSLSLSSPALS